MKTYIVVLGSTADLSANLKELEIEADSKPKAIELAFVQFPAWHLHDCVVKRNPWGGARAGSGQPAKWGEKTRVIRVPESVASKIELIIAIPELIELLERADEKIAKSPTSPRHDGLKELVADIRNLGF